MNYTDLVYTIIIPILATIWVYRDAVANQRERLWAVGVLLGTPVLFPLYFWLRRPKFYWCCPACQHLNRRWIRQCLRCHESIPEAELQARFQGFWDEADAVAIFFFAQVLLVPVALALGVNVGSGEFPSPSRQWLIELLHANLLLGLSFYCVTGRYRRTLTEIGLHPRGWERWLLLGVPIGVLLIFVQNSISMLMAWLASLAGVDLTGQFEKEMLGQLIVWPESLQDPLLIVVLFTVGVLAPMAEEVLVRGIGYKAARARFGPAKGMVLTSLVFAFLHEAPSFFPALFAVGLILNYLYERTHSLMPSIIAHAVLNSIVVLLGVYTQSKGG